MSLNLEGLFLADSRSSGKFFQRLLLRNLPLRIEISEAIAPTRRRHSGATQAIRFISLQRFSQASQVGFTDSLSQLN